MLGLKMNRWPDDALRRVVDAPIERWGSGGGGGGKNWGDISLDGDYEGRGCLYQHAARTTSFAEAAVCLDGSPSGVFRFDALRWRFGLPRVVRAIKIRARAILEERHPIVSQLSEGSDTDSRLVVLRAEVGT